MPVPVPVVLVLGVTSKSVCVSRGGKVTGHQPSSTSFPVPLSLRARISGRSNSNPIHPEVPDNGGECRVHNGHSPLTISNQPPHFQPSPTTTPVPIPLGAKSLSSALAPRPMSVRRFINHHQNGEGPMKFGRIDKPLYVRSIRQA